jgi:hypothetical protein
MSSACRHVRMLVSMDERFASVWKTAGLRTRGSKRELPIP